jgi:hypothetical protein
MSAPALTDRRVARLWRWSQTGDGIPRPATAHCPAAQPCMSSCDEYGNRRASSFPDRITPAYPMRPHRGISISHAAQVKSP